MERYNFLVSAGVVSVVVSGDDTCQIYLPGLNLRFQHGQHTTPINIHTPIEYTSLVQRGPQLPILYSLDQSLGKRSYPIPCVSHSKSLDGVLVGRLWVR